MHEFQSKLKNDYPRLYPIIFWIVLILAGFLFIWAISRFQSVETDWEIAFRPAALAVLVGKSPYSISTFYNPPWLLLPMIPLALLPERLVKGILIMASIAGYFVILRKLKASFPVTLIIFLSPPVVADILLININWLALLGYLLPPQIGLFFILIKPQVGAAMAVYWLVEAWRKGRLREVVSIFLPVSVVTLLSVVVFGPWMFRTSSLLDVSWNTSLFPLSIPIGLVLLVVALRTQQARFAYMASPFFFPYVALHSWGTVLIGLAPAALETLVAVIGFWVAMILVYI